MRFFSQPFSANPIPVELLIRHRADVNHADANGESPLHKSANFGDFQQTHTHLMCYKMVHLC